MRCPFLYIRSNMDYDKEIRKLEEALGMDPIWPCGSCIRKDEEFCSNKRCLQTLEETLEEKTE